MLLLARRETGKRERLVTAARRVLYEHGLEKTTLADIAAAADVPLGNVYYYLKTKDAQELAVALIAAYEGIALLAATLRDPSLISIEGDRLNRWIDSLGETRVSPEIRTGRA